LMVESPEAKAAHDLHVRPDGCLEMAFGAMLLQINGNNVLLDASLGEVDVPDYIPTGADGIRRVMFPLPESMETYAKIKPENVDFVIHSHLHADHIGWNVRHPPTGSECEPVITFPHAKHVIQREEWNFPAKHFACPWWKDWKLKCAPLENKGLLKLVDGDETLFPGVTLVLTKGHTPGHQCVRIESRGQVAYYVGDLLHTVPQVTWPEFCPIFDCCRWSSARAIEVERPPLDENVSVFHRRKLLERIHAEGAMLLSPHLPFPGMGRLEANGDGRFRWAPVPAQGDTCAVL